MSKSGIPIVSDVAHVAGQVIQPIAKVLSPLAPILPFLPIPGLAGNPAAAALLTGILSGYGGKGKGFDFNRGLMSGALSYGLGSLMQGAQAAGQVGAPPTPTGAFDAGVGLSDYAAAMNAGPQTAVPAGSPSIFSTAPAPTPSIADSLSNFASQTAQNATDVGTGIKNLVTGTPDAYSAFKGAMGLSPVQTAGIAFGGYAGTRALDELEKQKAQAEAILQDSKNKTQAEIDFAQSVLRDYPANFKRLTAEDVSKYGYADGGDVDYDQDDQSMAYGGLASLAGGGMPPRFLSGGGDGMSDSIPARIDGKQEARLADGEFVVPADVVSHLGNGSSNAGAKRLYNMMDKVRKARTGRVAQAPAVSPQRYMPA